MVRGPQFTVALGQGVHARVVGEDALGGRFLRRDVRLADGKLPRLDAVQRRASVVGGVVLLAHPAGQGADPQGGRALLSDEQQVGVIGIVRRRWHDGKKTGIVKLRVKGTAAPDVVRFVEGINSRTNKFLGTFNLVSALVEVHRGRQPFLVVANAGIIGIQVVVRLRLWVDADRGHVPVAARVTRLRQGNQHRRLCGVHIGDGEYNPALGQVVINDLRVEHKTVAEAGPKIAQPHLAQQLTLTRLDGDLGIESHHQMLGADRAVRIGRDGRMVVDHPKKIIAHARLEIASQQPRAVRP